MSATDALDYFEGTGALLQKKAFPTPRAPVKRGHLNAPGIGAATSADDDLVVVVQKVQRFKAILRALKAKGVRAGNALRLQRAHV